MRSASSQLYASCCQTIYKKSLSTVHSSFAVELS